MPPVAKDEFEKQYLPLQIEVTFRVSNSSCLTGFNSYGVSCAAKTKHPLQVKVPFRGRQWTLLRCHPKRNGFIRGKPRLRSRREAGTKIKEMRAMGTAKLTHAKEFLNLIAYRSSISLLNILISHLQLNFYFINHHGTN